MPTFELKSWWNDHVIVSVEVSEEEWDLRFKIALQKGIESKADLSKADLREADLREANLRWADLRWADLRWADLRWADLREANLRWADLSKADLRWADLSKADLREADLREANLRWADLAAIRKDFFAVLDHAPREVAGLRRALAEGRIEGSCYEGQCCCLVGTIANLRGEEYTRLSGIRPNSDSPIERFFLAIRQGDTPANSAVARIIDDWMAEWEAAHTSLAVNQ